MIGLVDSDIVCYRVAASCENETSETVLSTLVSFVGGVMCYADDVWDFEWYLTGRSNFRHQYAVTVPYKGNRTDKEKPKYLKMCREWMQSEMKAKMSVDEEADDLIAIRATELKGRGIIMSVDKDFMQVPGKHYNFVKRTWETVTEWDGLLFFYKQILTGDRADNILGMKGVGPVKAAKMLKDANTEAELYRCCVEALGEERVVENARLLWLRRLPGQIWEPPKGE